MAKPNLYPEHFQDYKLIAPNLFDYLQLVDFVNDNKSYFFNISPQINKL